MKEFIEIKVKLVSLFISSVVFIKEDGTDLILKTRFIKNLNTNNKNLHIDDFQPGKSFILKKHSDTEYYIFKN